jgi:hypothetical protein
MTITEPYTFDVPAYQGCYDFAASATDKRHVYMIHDLLMAWSFEHTLEIGCFFGASSTAFVEAINRGSRMDATFCDVSISDSLYTVLNNCQHPSRVHLTPQPSWQVLDSEEPWDFIFVDASHDIDTVTLEIKRLLRRRPLCVMAHDTNATAAGFSKCEGAELLKRTFQTDPGYLCIEDDAHRPGEATHRGLFLATTSPELYYDTAARVFRDWK